MYFYMSLTMRTSALVLASLVCAAQTSDQKQYGSSQATPSSDWLAEVEQSQSNARTAQAFAFAPLSPGLIGLGPKPTASNAQDARAEFLGRNVENGRGNSNSVVWMKGSDVLIDSDIDSAQSTQLVATKGTDKTDHVIVVESLFEEVLLSQGALPGIDGVATLDRFRPCPVSASSVTEKWMQHIAKASPSIPELFDEEFKAKEVPEKRQRYFGVLDETAEKSAIAYASLLSLALGIEKNPPTEIQALVTATYGVMAMAVATKKLQKDYTGQLQKIGCRQGLADGCILDVDEKGEGAPIEEKMKVVDIELIVASPMPGIKPEWLETELLLQIVRCAAASGHLVVLTPANESLKKFYEEIGFEGWQGPTDYGGQMVYSKPLPDQVRDNPRGLKLASLQIP